MSRSGRMEETLRAVGLLLRAGDCVASALQGMQGTHEDDGLRWWLLPNPQGWPLSRTQTGPTRQDAHLTGAWRGTES
jgi:hypothetical protein